MGHNRMNIEWLSDAVKFWLAVLGLALIAGLAAGWALSAEPSPTPLPVATPAPTPIDPTEWLSWIEAQPTAETFWISEFAMPDGDTRLAERVMQVPGAGCGVVSTRGYIKGPGGYWNQGFVENEVSEPVSWIMRAFEGIAYAAQGKVKSSHKFQAKLERKPDKLKSIKWTADREIKW